METHELYIVDDNADHRYLLQQILNKFLPDFQVRFFEGGEQLFCTLNELALPGSGGRLLAAIILDLHMPYLDGIQILNMIKKQARTHLQWSVIPIIIMTSGGTEQQVTDCYNAGASAFVKKPAEFTHLKDLLITICQFWIGANRIPKLKNAS